MRHAARVLVAAMALSFLLPLAQAQEPKVRISLPAQQECWVGERVTFVVELLAPGFFSGTASFDLPMVPGLLLAPPTSHPIVSSETIAGASYTVQRHELSAFSRRGGAQTIPGFPVRFGFKRNPLDAKIVPATIQTEELTFTMNVPPGAEHLGNLLSARGLKVEETWSPEPGRARAGDAFTRLIVYTAPNVPAMVFPPFRVEQIDGLGIYAKPPEVLDHAERGSFTGERRDTFTYVCQRPGHFVIPAARLTWFDLEAHELRSIDFPSRTLEVAPNPALTASTPQPARGERRSIPWRAVLLLVAVLGVSVALLRRVPAAFWRELVAPLRPVRLAPLNPAPRLSQPNSSSNYP